MPRKPAGREVESAKEITQTSLDLAPANGKLKSGKRRRTARNGDLQGHGAEPVSTHGGVSPTNATSSSPPREVPGSRPRHVPTAVEVKSELWRIATGEGSEASRVSALRALADILGLMRADPPELPEAMSAYMDALALGLARPSES